MTRPARESLEVLAYIRDHPGSTRHEVAEGMGRPFAGVSRSISRLALAKKLRADGAGKFLETRRWFAVENVAPPTPPKVSAMYRGASSIFGVQA